MLQQSLPLLLKQVIVKSILPFMKHFLAFRRVILYHTRKMEKGDGFFQTVDKPRILNFSHRLVSLRRTLITSRSLARQKKRTGLPFSFAISGGANPAYHQSFFTGT